MEVSREIFGKNRMGTVMRELIGKIHVAVRRDAGEFVDMVPENEIEVEVLLVEEGMENIKEGD